MGVLANFKAGARRAFGYDAVDTGATKRKQPNGILRSEDDELTADKRRRLTSGLRDVRRNFSIAGWMIRKHLDYVSTFTFQSRTNNPDIDKRVEELMKWWMRPANCDAAGRHSFPRLIRTLEGSRCVDGDGFVLKLNDGRLQLIEGDRVRNPLAGESSIDTQKFVQGVKVDAAGRALAYAVHKRRRVTGFEFERTIASGRMLQHGFFERYDQVRGISPVAAALNTFQDVYEGFDYALAKAKVAQLFGLVFYRGSIESMSHEELEDNAAPAVDFGKGAAVLDLDPGDRAEFLENKTPSGEFQSFTQTMIGVALKSLDIPYSFYDESYTNFFGSRSALLQYQKSCESKREDLQEILRQLTAWRLGNFIQDGVLVLPAGMTVADLKWEWTPRGMPWWDPSKEMAGDIAGIKACLRTRTDILKERDGGDFKEVVDKLAEEQQYMQEKGVLVDMAGAELLAPLVAPAVAQGSTDDE